MPTRCRIGAGWLEGTPCAHPSRATGDHTPSPPMITRPRLIIWSGNLPEEIPWYLRRTRGVWEAVAVSLIVFHFAIPFLLLLSRAVKRDVRALATIAGLILIMRVVDLYWTVMPAFAERGIGVHWSNAAAFLGIGGLWVAGWAWEVRRHELVPVRDPRWMEVKAAHG